MDLDDARRRFVDWLCREDTGHGMPVDADADGRRRRGGLGAETDQRAMKKVLVRLCDDIAPLPARARFQMPGCHVPTHAHAARLAEWAIRERLVAGIAALPHGLEHVPQCLLHEANRRTDDEVRHLRPGQGTPDRVHAAAG